MADLETIATAKRCDAQEILRILQKCSAEKCDTGAGKYRLEDIIEEGTCYAVKIGGNVVAGYVLEAQGSELWIKAAASNSLLDMTTIFDQLIEKQAQEFDSIGFQTRRKGLVKKAEKLGYEIHGYIMRKKLK